MVVEVGRLMSFETVFRKRNRLVATQHNMIRSHRRRRIFDEPVSTNDKPPTELFLAYFWKLDFLTTFESVSIALSSPRSPFFVLVIFSHRSVVASYKLVARGLHGGGVGLCQLGQLNS